MTATPAGDSARSRDLARLRDLTGPHLAHPSAPIQLALPHLSPADHAETIGILGDPDESAFG